jgi:hypothetical protein
MSLIAFRLDELLDLNLNTNEILNRKKDIDFIISHTSSIPQSSISHFNKKSIKHYFISTFKNNYYLPYLLDSLNTLKINDEIDKKSKNKIVDAYIKHIIKISKELSQKLSTDLNIIENNSDSTHFDDFINFLNTNNCIFSKNIENEIADLLEKNESENILSDYYILCLIKDNKIIASTLQRYFIFKQTIQLSNFCGDYISIIKHSFKTFSNFNFIINISIKHEDFTLKTMLDLIECNLECTSITFNNNKFHLILKHLSTDTQKVNLNNIKSKLETQFNIIQLENDLIKLKTNYNELENLYIFSNENKYIKTIFSLLLKLLNFSKIKSIFHYLRNKIHIEFIFDFLNNSKISLFSLFLKLLINSNSDSNSNILKISNYQISNNLTIKQIETGNLLDLNNKCNISENTIHYLIYDLTYSKYNLLDISIFCKPLLEIIQQTHLFSNSILSTEGLFEDNMDFVRLTLHSELNTENIENIKNKIYSNSNTLLKSIDCKADILFFSSSLFYFPSKDTPKILYCGTKATVNKDNSDKLIVYVNLFTESKDSEICIYSIEDNIPNKEELESLLTDLSMDKIKIAVIASPKYFMFITYNSKVNSKSISLDFNTTAENDLNTLLEIIKTKLESLKFNVEVYTRDEMLNLDKIVIHYEKLGVDTCFPDTQEYNSNEMLEGQVRMIDMDMENLAPFYQLDDRVVHIYNNEVDIYDEDSRDDENRQYKYTFYEYGMLMEEFNKYGIPEDDPADVLSEEDTIPLTNDEYIEVYQDYSVFSRNQIVDNNDSVDKPFENEFIQTEVDEVEDVKKFDKYLKEYNKLFEGEKMVGHLKKEVEYELEPEDMMINVKVIKEKSRR